MKKLKLVICVLIICIIISCLFLIKLVHKRQEGSLQGIGIQNRENPNDGMGVDKTLKKLSNINMYITIENILNNYKLYFQNINMDVKIELGRTTTSETEERSNLYKESINAIKSLFDKQYLEYNNINESQIKEYIAKYKNKSGNSAYNLDIQEINEGYVTPSTSVYLIYSKINNIDFKFMIKLDISNKTYSVFWEDYLKENNYSEQRTEKISISEANVEKNNYNYFMMVYADNTTIVNRYFDNYKKLLINNPNKLYEILDKEYREKKFSSYENFLNYLRRTSNRFSNLEVSKYQYKNDTIKVIDNYENYYTFKISDVMKYTIMLDNYTIIDEETKEIYSNSTEKEKVYLNTARFLNMINNKDYEMAYALLDSGFKANKYPSLDKFIETLKNNLFDYNSIESASKYTKSGDNNIFVLNIKNGEKDDSQKKEMTLIMKLKEETDFVMSFSFK